MNHSDAANNGTKHSINQANTQRRPAESEQNRGDDSSASSASSSGRSNTSLSSEWSEERGDDDHDGEKSHMRQRYQQQQQDKVRTPMSPSFLQPNNTSDHFHNPFSRNGSSCSHSFFDRETPVAAAETTETETNNNSHNGSNSNIPTDQERQIILVLLLAQFCALHDPTPRTFTVHVLELFERGILGRQAIQFLYEMGFLPAYTAMAAQASLRKQQPALLLPAPPLPANDEVDDEGIPNVSSSQNWTATSAVTAPDDDVSYGILTASRIPQRSREASAIRTTLEAEERHRLMQQQAAAAKKKKKQSAAGVPKSSSSPTSEETMMPSPTSSPPPQVSFSAEHHPLSLSRYQREFTQISLLSFGSFGHVFHATNKMDGRDYAVKRVPFRSQGYASDSVQQVMREVHCLAACNHAHVVRYYTSWLEPSWMTGGASTSTTAAAAAAVAALGASSSSSSNSYGRSNHFQKIKKFLTERPANSYSVDHLSVEPSVRWSADSSHQGGENYHTDDDQNEFSLHDQFSQPLYLHSKDRSDNISWDVSENEEDGANDLVVAETRAGVDSKEGMVARRDRSSSNYRYEICLFIQMQLCSPVTLGDWIRQRNHDHPDMTLVDRMNDAARIFHQIASGLAHVHEKGIIHRDLKPANVFRSKHDDCDNSLHFMIGDFGLSKLIAQQNQRYHGDHKTMVSFRQESYADSLSIYDGVSALSPESKEVSWRDPLTAGVGTASYAAPEQVASQTYGNRTDIFSLGLILLEMLCCFSTEHERLQTFAECRNQRMVPPELKAAFPNAAQVILTCTDPCPLKRPSAQELVFAELAAAKTKTIETIGDDRTDASVCFAPPICESSPSVEVLLRQLAERDAQLKRYEEQNQRQQQTIIALRREVERLQGRAKVATRPRVFSFPTDDSESDYGGSSVGPTLSSSEDEL